MDTWLHYLKIVRYMYRLEEPDLLYVVDSATSLLNWAIPAVVGGWLVKRLYLLERKPVRLRVRLGLSLCPLLFPVLSVSFLYFLYFQNDPRLPGLIQKYPIGFDFLSRPKISPMRKKTQAIMKLSHIPEAELSYSRFKRTNLPFTINNGFIYSFAINEVTSELLYSDQRGIHLVAVAENESVKSIPYTEVMKQELGRYSDRKQQEIVQMYAAHGVQYLNSVQHLNIWVGVVSRKKFVFFSEELMVSNESPIDISGITSVKLNRDTGDIFTLTGEGKIMVWTCEIISDSVKKRTDFDVKIVQKKTFNVDIPITKFDMSTKGFSYVAGVTEPVPGGTAAIHLWELLTSEKLPSIPHSEGYNTSVSITAIGLRDHFLAFIDSSKSLIVRDVAEGLELHRKNLLSVLGLVDSIIFEDSDLSSGIYLMETSGRVIDYSVSVMGILSIYSHQKTKEVNSGWERKSVEKMYITSIRTGILDEKAQPGTAQSRFNTTVFVISLSSGLKQLWTLYDGCIDVVDLASIGQVLALEGKICQARKLAFNPGARWAFPVSGISDILEIYMCAGELHLINPMSQQTIAKYQSSPQDQQDPGLCELSLDMTSIVVLSPAGQLSCFNFQTNVSSQGYQLSKLVVTAMSIAPKYVPESNRIDSSNVFLVTMGTDSGVILVFEFQPKTQGFDLRKRYAAHDAVVEVVYRYWDRRVMTVGRDGYVKFLLCDQYYEWDGTSYKGFWNDCSACGLCGHSMVLLGYKSGMLQALYFSPSTNYPISSLLEYHTTSIICISGLDLSLAEGLSGDDMGAIVLWNLEKSEPLKVFRVHTLLNSLVAIGNPLCEGVFAVTNSSILHIKFDRYSVYRRITKKDIANYKSEIKKNRFDQKKRGNRTSGLRTSSSFKPLPESREGSIERLRRKMTVAKVKLETETMDIARTQSTIRPLEEDSTNEEKPKTGRLGFELIKSRAMGRIIEAKQVERFKRSVAQTIRNAIRFVPREMLFSGRFQAAKLLVTPVAMPVHSLPVSPIVLSPRAAVPGTHSVPQFVYESPSPARFLRKFGVRTSRSRGKSLLQKRTIRTNTLID